jgi:uncharacterized membrane protein HdeD (DUF308 family)
MTPPLEQQFAGPGFDRRYRHEPWKLAGDLTEEELRRARRRLIVAGILALVAGVFSIAVPVIASVTTAVFIGWVLVASGIALAIQAISHRAALRGLEALITLLAGFYILVFPLNGTVTLTFVLAVWFFAGGILQLTYAVHAGGGTASWINGVGGTLSVILGILIAASLPSSAAWAIGLVVGINLLFWGTSALAGARLLKQRAGTTGS